MICQDCGDVLVKRCGATRASQCEPCGKTYVGRLQSIVESGLTGSDQYQPERDFFCTLTAPGVADGLTWDPSVCRHGPDVECSGKRGCRTDVVPAAIWNGTAARRKSWFFTYLRRRLGPLEYFAVWEDQQRGVLHMHFVIRLARPTSTKRVRAAVRNSGRRWGFGSQYDVRAIKGETAGQAAWYVAKYSTKTADSISGRLMLDPRTGELAPSKRFRVWSSSRQWGDSMRTVRARQCAWAQATARQRSAAPGAGGALDSKREISTGPVTELLLPADVRSDQLV
jgi:hypothetical protein